MPPKFELPLDSRTQQFTFPAPFPASLTNATIFSDYARGAKGDLRNTSSIQPVSLKSGISQSVNSTNTLFPKPIDVVALLSGADQFSSRSGATKQHHLGLPGPMQLFSTLSISDDARRTVNTSTRLNSSIPYTSTEQGEGHNKVVKNICHCLTQIYQI